QPRTRGSQVVVIVRVGVGFEVVLVFVVEIVDVVVGVVLIFLIVGLEEVALVLVQVVVVGDGRVIGPEVGLGENVFDARLGQGGAVVSLERHGDKPPSGGSEDSGVA